MSDQMRDGQAAAAYQANQPLPTPSFAPLPSFNLPPPTPLSSGSTNSGIGFNNDPFGASTPTRRFAPDPSSEPASRDYSSDRYHQSTWRESLIPIGRPATFKEDMEPLLGLGIGILRSGIGLLRFGIRIGPFILLATMIVLVTIFCK